MFKGIIVRPTLENRQYSIFRLHHPINAFPANTSLKIFTPAFIPPKLVFMSQGEINPISSLIMHLHRASFEFRRLNVSRSKVL
jgi:hypothetical protein